MLSAPDAPAPTAIASSEAKASTGCMADGAIMTPASAVNTTSDITRGFSSAKKSRGCRERYARLRVTILSGDEAHRLSHSIVRARLTRCGALFGEARFARSRFSKEGSGGSKPPEFGT